MLKLSLSEALDLFEPHLDDIADALAENVTAKIEALHPIEIKETDIATKSPIYIDNLRYILEGMREVEIDQITEIPLKTIRRIQSRKYYQQVEATQGTNYERITDEDIQRAKEVPIEEIFEGELKRSGNRLWGKLRNEDTASFCIHPDNRWSDYGDNIHGDGIDLYMRIHNVDFISAVRALARL